MSNAKHVTTIALVLAGLGALWLGCSSKGDQQAQPAPTVQAVPQPAVPGAIQPGQNPIPVAPAQPVQPTVPPTAQPGQPVQPGQPAQPQNPMGNLMNALGAAGAVPAGGVALIPWQSLSQALPVNATGWSLDGQIEGQSAQAMGIAMSHAECKLKQGAMTAEVKITDTSMNPALAMPFNMMRTVQVDSSTERMGPINFGTYPGTQKFHKKRNRAEVMVFVANRILVQIEVNNANAEASAVGLAQQVNYPHIAQLVTKKK